MILNLYKMFFRTPSFIPLMALVVLFVISCKKENNNPRDPEPLPIPKGLVNLGPQIILNTVQGSTFTSDKQGKEFIYTVVRGTVGHLVGIELETGQALANLPLEGSAGSWDIEVTTDGILYICTSEGYLYKHVPGTQSVENLGKALSGENYLWDLAPGKSGEIFGATYPGCKVFRYHPNDGFSDIGGQLVSSEDYVRSIVYHEKTDMIYAGIGSHAHLVELNPRTGEKREFLPEQYKSEEFVYHLSIIEDDQKGDKLLIYLTGSKKTLLYNLETKAFEGEIQIADVHVKSAIKSLETNTAYFTAAGGLYEWNLDEGTTKSLGTGYGTALATKWGSDGKLQLFNTQRKLLELNVAQGDKDETQLVVPGQSVQINYVAYNPIDYKVWTGGYLAGSNATYDQVTGTTTGFTGLGQTESMTFLGQNAYFGVYPSARIYKFDNTKPWQFGTNPKLIGQVAGQDRPFGGLGIEQLNKVYFGTVPDYGKNGGALVEYNASTDKMTIYEHDQVVKNQSIVSLVYSEGLLYGGSSNRGGLGIDPTETEAKMFVWYPLNNRKITELVPVENAKSITCLVESPDKKIWGLASGTLFIYDPVSGTVVERHKLYDSTASIGEWKPGAIIFMPDGFVYVQERQNLYKIDPKTMQFEIMESAIQHLVTDGRGALYFAKKEDLWQYKP